MQTEVNPFLNRTHIVPDFFYKMEHIFFAYDSLNANAGGKFVGNTYQEGESACSKSTKTPTTISMRTS